MGFRCLKIDGQHLNGAPPCFNTAHGHASPEDAPEGVPGFFRAVWEEAMATKPDAVVLICPCGTAYSFFTMPYLNMVVASDPESSWQVRLKGKTLKALLGDGVAYFGDFVELSAGGEDFASTLGVGGVVGTNFAWPGAPGKKDKKLLLTPEREKAWAFWVKLYQEKRLSQGEYLGSSLRHRLRPPRGARHPQGGRSLLRLLRGSLPRQGRAARAGVPPLPRPRLRDRPRLRLGQRTAGDPRRTFQGPPAPRSAARSRRLPDPPRPAQAQRPVRLELLVTGPARRDGALP